MKRLFFEKTYWPFLLTGAFTFIIAVYLRYAHPNEALDLNYRNNFYNIPDYKIWFIFSLYLGLMAILYYLVNRKKIRTRKWMVTLHYIFIILFLIFFVGFSLLNNREFQSLIASLSLLNVILIYGIIVILDVSFLLAGVVLFIINLITLKKKG